MRVRSLDVARGVAVGGMLYLTYIPGREYGFAVHAEWFGVTPYDLVLPMFLVLFGAALGYAYRDEVRWASTARRTVGLVAVGLAFNAVVGWDLAPSSLRLTGVLQVFAVTGAVSVAVLAVTRAAWTAGLAGVGLVAAHGAVLVGVGRRCPGGLVTPECNPSALIDPIVFGADRLYHGSAAGYDPEGLGALLGITGTVVIGAAVGRWFGGRVTDGAAGGLALVAAVLLVATVPLAWVVPVGKPPWTPAFAALTAGVTVATLAACHLLLEQRERRWRFGRTAGRAGAWVLEAIGRNSLLVYVGMFALVAVLANVEATVGGETAALGDHLLGAVAWSPRPELTYAALLTGAWTAVAAALHRLGWYWRV